MNALNARAPSARSAASSSRLCPTAAAYSPKSAIEPRSASDRFVRRLSTSVTSGSAWGISITVVIPPATAEAVPWAKSSRSIFEGSRRWVWMSTPPGKTCRPVASNRSPLEPGGILDDPADPPVANEEVRLEDALLADDRAARDDLEARGAHCSRAPVTGRRPRAGARRRRGRAYGLFSTVNSSRRPRAASAPCSAGRSRARCRGRRTGWSG